MYHPEIPVTQEMVDAYGHAWATTPKGEPGDRTRAGLRAALKVHVDKINDELRAELDPDSIPKES